MESYNIVRFYRNNQRRRIIHKGVTLEVAQLHCRDERTHKIDKMGNIVWFDGYESVG